MKNLRGSEYFPYPLYICIQYGRFVGFGCCSPSARGVTIHDLSRFFVMLVFLFCKLFEQYSQTNFPIIKTNPFKVTKYKKVLEIFRPKWVKIKIFVIILSLLLKNENKDTHYKYTYTNKINSVLLSGRLQ